MITHMIHRHVNALFPWIKRVIHRAGGVKLKTLVLFPKRHQFCSLKPGRRTEDEL